MQTIVYAMTEFNENLNSLFSRQKCLILKIIAYRGARCELRRGFLLVCGKRCQYLLDLSLE